MKTPFIATCLLLGIVGTACAAEPRLEVPPKPPEIKGIKAYCLDFNWAATGRKRKPFAPPGSWAGADPAQHVAWYKAMGANVVQTFCVSTNGYAWYKNGFVPEQPKLKHDFLPEVVKLGHKEGMLVFGYFCLSSNPVWGTAHPDQSYGTPTTYHIPYTDEYLAYLSSSISDAVRKTGIDGFMIDWLWMPNRGATQGKWLDCEKKLYQQLMGEAFPGEDKLSKDQDLDFSRKAIDCCWKAIRKAAKEANPNCIIWLTSNQIKHPHVINSDMYKEADWLMNESGDTKSIDAVKAMVGPHTRLITCLARWNGQDATKVVPQALAADIGLYGFTVPRTGGGLIPLDKIFAKPVAELEGDDRNIAVLARAYHGVSINAVWQDGRFVEPAPAETTEAREQRIQWWRDARFGMFIHWGLYAIPGGTWKDKVHKEGYSEWIMFDEKIPAKEYETLAGKFNPVKFDARAWTGIARKAGMKYLVLTTKHHDGFSMFQSSLTPYNVAAATPFKRDVTRELVDACRDSGLHFGCYYSVDRDWYRPQGPGNNYKQANVWDYPDSKREDFDRYFATFAKPQVEELLSKYQPDLLWFDEIDMKTDAQVEALYQTIRKLRPECVINSRIQGCRFPAKIPPPHCDYISTGDNEIAAKSIGFEWENPGSMNTSYGYNPNDHNWVSAAEIISRLVEIVSKGGNYLLNVGPTPEGLIPQPCVDRLAEVGDWMAVNGEAIYGTSASVFGDSAPGPAGNWRCTVKPGKIYLHLFKWPADGWFDVPGLQSKVTKAYLMAGRKELKVVKAAGGVGISLPAEAPDQIASVICLEIADPVAKIATRQ